MSDQATPAITTARVPQPEYTAEQILEHVVLQSQAQALGITLLIAAVGGEVHQS